MSGYEEIVVRVEEEIMDLIPAHLENRRVDVRGLEVTTNNENHRRGR